MKKNGLGAQNLDWAPKVLLCRSATGWRMIPYTGSGCPILKAEILNAHKEIYCIIIVVAMVVVVVCALDPTLINFKCPVLSNYSSFPTINLFLRNHGILSKINSATSGSWTLYSSHCTLDSLATYPTVLNHYFL